MSVKSSVDRRKSRCQDLRPMDNLLVDSFKVSYELQTRRGPLQSLIESPITLRSRVKFSTGSLRLYTRTNTWCWGGLRDVRWSNSKMSQSCVTRRRHTVTIRPDTLSIFILTIYRLYIVLSVIWEKCCLVTIYDNNNSRPTILTLNLSSTLYRS